MAFPHAVHAVESIQFGHSQQDTVFMKTISVGLSYQEWDNYTFPVTGPKHRNILLLSVLKPTWYFLKSDDLISFSVFLMFLFPLFFVFFYALVFVMSQNAPVLT